MMNKIIFALLLFSAGLNMSFSPSLVVYPAAEDGGNTLTVSNPAPGTAIMSWSFTNPSALTSGIIIEDIIVSDVVASYSQVSGSTFTVSGLAPGYYKVTVTNGNNYISDDVIIN